MTPTNHSGNATSTRHTTRAATRAVIAVLLVATATGCTGGGSGQTPDPTPAPSPSQTYTPAPSDAAAPTQPLDAAGRADAARIAALDAENIAAAIHRRLEENPGEPTPLTLTLDRYSERYWNVTIPATDTGLPAETLSLSSDNRLGAYGVTPTNQPGATKTPGWGRASFAVCVRHHTLDQVDAAAVVTAAGPGDLTTRTATGKKALTLC